ncbi:Fic family protein [Methylovirgula sp. 4M-Z18]|uniref:Fic family protein n=1 Tax=Methylovirgula sp. 4M-Z18 TaxID=2293567 RepID=UPI0013146A7A|nr:Fic family protein [Methylovirgula sp. 4M-Z18]
MATDDKKTRLEGLWTRRRILELREHPVRGVFDAAHLLEINRRIFQDMPRFGFPEYRPGEFRPPVIRGDWLKYRQLESNDKIFCIAYSDMGRDARRHLETFLEAANPDTLKTLKTADFTKAMGDLYSRLDYIHPFRDGNSRTLREFTRQLAEAAGYTVDWERFNENKFGRDVLYIARDKSVNELSFPHLRDADTKRDVAFTRDSFARSRDLPDLLRDAVRPSRAIAFEKEDRETALKKFPELATHYALLDLAEAQASERFSADPRTVVNVVADIKSRMVARLDTGDVQIARAAPEHARADWIERDEHDDARDEGRER